MTLACVLITHLPARVEVRRWPDLKDRPVVIVDRTQGRPVTVDRLPAAAASIGATLDEALSLHAGTVVLEADAPAYRAAFQRVLTALQGVSDRVEGAELGTVYVALDGLQEMYGGEARLVGSLLNAVPAYLTPRVGVAEGKFPALVAAYASAAHSAVKVPQNASAFLAPHPIGLLPVPAYVRAGMGRFGLRTLGDVGAMAREAMVDRLGSQGGLAWDLAHGIDHSWLRPMRHEETVVEQVALPSGAVSLDLLPTAVDTPLRRACARPLMRGRGGGGRAAPACALPDASKDQEEQMAEAVRRLRSSGTAA